jgi:hypothetical protein
MEHAMIATNLAASAGAAMLLLLAIPVALAAFELKEPRALTRALSFIVLSEAVMVLFGTGYMRIISMDSAFLALCLPLTSVWVWPLLLVAIAKARGATAVVILAVEAVTYLLSMKVRPMWKAIPLGVLALLGWIVPGKDFYAGGERLPAWQHYFGWFRSQGTLTQLFGVGVGGVEGWTPFIGPIHGFYYFQLHNDWLQLLIEMGVAGSVLVLAAFSYGAAQARGRVDLLAAWLGFGAFALTYHPLRSFLPQVILVYLVRRIFSGRRKYGS